MLSHSSNALLILLSAFFFALISFSPVSASSVQLQWDVNTEPDLAGYRVYHNVKSAPLAGTVPLDVRNQTTATISGLDPYQSYSIAVTAYNRAGLESSFSNIVSVPSQALRPATVVTDLISPTVALNSPLNSAALSGVVPIRATAGDNVAVKMVEFYINGSLRYASNLPPYNYDWDTREAGNGTYTLMAKAYDTAAHTSKSSDLTVTVNNRLPVSRTGR